MGNDHGGHGHRPVGDVMSGFGKKSFPTATSWHQRHEESKSPVGEESRATTPTDPRGSPGQEDIGHAPAGACTWGLNLPPADSRSRYAPERMGSSGIGHLNHYTTLPTSPDLNYGTNKSLNQRIMLQDPTSSLILIYDSYVGTCSPLPLKLLYYSGLLRIGWSDWGPETI